MEIITITKSNVKLEHGGELNIDGKVILPKSAIHAFIRWTYAVSHTPDTWPLCVGSFYLDLDKDEAVSLRKELRKVMLIDDRVSCSCKNIETYYRRDYTVFDFPRREEHPVMLALNIQNYCLSVWYEVKYPKEWEVTNETIDAALEVYRPCWSEKFKIMGVRNPNNFSSKITYNLA